MAGIRRQKDTLDFLTTATLNNLLLRAPMVHILEIQESLSPREKQEVAQRLRADGYEESAKIVLENTVITSDV